MAIVKPFAALRPDPPLAGRVCELPYDVLSSTEACRAAVGNPLSFFHISKPEIDLAPEADPYGEEVYAQGARAFASLREQGVLRQDAQAVYYLYRQIMGPHRQLGLVAVTSCEEYLRNRIRKHELTRPEKEDDRVRHIKSLNAQTGPAFLVYPNDPQLNQVFEAAAALPPEIDFTAGDGVRHSSWVIREPATCRQIEQRFLAMPALYIADGHHRSAAAARIYSERQGAGRSAWFLSVLFPHDQVQVLPYHRVVKDLHGLSPEQFLARLEPIFEVCHNATAAPARLHEVSLYLRGAWSALRFRGHLTSSWDPLRTLDVGLLQEHVLGPILGIDNPRTSDRINFVGGIRGPAELKRLVDAGTYACAFAMFPTSVEALMAVAEAGGLMPPKSTWFEPKLRDGMFSHLLDEMGQTSSGPR